MHNRLNRFDIRFRKIKRDEWRSERQPSRDEVLRKIDRAAQEGAKVLRFRGDLLTELPREIWQLTNLEDLDLAENDLTELPAEIGQLVNLKRLLLRDNCLTELPCEIGQLTKLETLDLSGNLVTEFPSEMEQLTSLKGLFLWKNPIPIPNDIMGLVYRPALVIRHYLHGLEWANLFSLTPRELEACQLLGEGLDTPAIAEKLSIKVESARDLVRRVKRKTEAEGSNHLEECLDAARKLKNAMALYGLDPERVLARRE